MVGAIEQEYDKNTENIVVKYHMFLSSKEFKLNVITSQERR